MEKSHNGNYRRFQIASSISLQKLLVLGHKYVDANETSKDPPMITDPDCSSKKSLEFEHSLVDIFYAGSSWCFVWKIHIILRSLI